MACDTAAFLLYAFATRGRAVLGAWREGPGRVLLSGLLGILSFVGMGILLLIPTRATLLPRRRQNEDDAGTP